MQLRIIFVNQKKNQQQFVHAIWFNNLENKHIEKCFKIQAVFNQEIQLKLYSNTKHICF